MLCADNVSSISKGHAEHDSHCEFPVGWWGNWYQSGLGVVTISLAEINHKGTCFRHLGDFYVVENRLNRLNCITRFR